MKQVKASVGGKEYTIINIGALKSIQIASKLSKVVIPAITGGSDNIASVLIENMDKVDIPQIIQDLTSGTTVYLDGTGVNFDRHYAEFPEDLIPVLAHSLKENVLGFFTPNALQSLTDVLAGMTQD